MAVQQIAALVIDQSTDSAQELLRALQPEVQFAASDFTESLRKAVLSHTEEEFQICFVSASFGEAETESFFKDMLQLKRTATCLFVQVRDSVPEDLDRESLKKVGFSLIVSRKGAHQDKEALQKLLENRFYLQEVKKRKVSVDDMMAMLLKEIDRAATDHRRGVHRKMAAIPMDGIDLDTKFDPEVLEGYFDALEKRTGEALPRLVERLDIPEEVLQRALPGLTKNGYTGASHRVWELLANKYGVKIGQPPGEKTPPAPSEPKQKSEEKK